MPKSLALASPMSRWPPAARTLPTPKSQQLDVPEVRRPAGHTGLWRLPPPHDPERRLSNVKAEHVSKKEGKNLKQTSPHPPSKKWALKTQKENL